MSGKWLLKVVVSDIRYFWLQSVFDLSILVALITLLLTLWSLKTGIVSGYAREQLNTPESMRVFVKPSGPITFDNLRYLESRPEVGYVAPSVGFFNQRMDVKLDKTGKNSIANVVASGIKDPLLSSLSLAVFNRFSAVLGTDLATVLGAVEGDRVVLNFNIGSREAHNIELLVIGIVDSSAWMERALFVDSRLSTALSILSYADPGRIRFDGSVQNFGVVETDEFSEIRLYANKLENVAGLVKIVNQLGWRAESREALINERISLENSTSIIFVVVLSCVFFAVAVAIALSNLNRFARLRKGLQGLEWSGLSKDNSILIFVLQSFLITISGLLGAVVLSLILIQLLDAVLGPLLVNLGVSGEVGQLEPLQVFLFATVLIIFDIFISTLSVLLLQNTSKTATGVFPC